MPTSRGRIAIALERRGTRYSRRFPVERGLSRRGLGAERRAMKKSGRAGRHSVYNDPDPVGKTEIQNYTKAIS